MKRMMRFNFPFFIGCFISAQLCLAQAAIQSEPYTWKNVKVVVGGFVPGIEFSTKEPGLAYCRTDIGSVYRWDNANKKWIPLTDMIGESNFHGGESVAPDPVDANNVYVAAGMYGSGPAAILRSHDKGNSWDITPVPFTMGGNEDGRGVGERLVVDPNDNNVLYFGSRHDGLWMSIDQARTWKKVESFPLKGEPRRQGQRNRGAGLSFVVFDAASGHGGAATPTIYVGSADVAGPHLFRSADAGKSWKAIPGEPADLLAIHGALDTSGSLYLVYDNGVGPNGVTKGQLWKLDTKNGKWLNISPEKNPSAPGGYGGLALDLATPGALAVSTMNRWSPVDTVFRSTDGGETWKDIREKSHRDPALSPYLFWGDPQPKLGWWMAALAIDPFDSNHAAYGTGATIWATNNFTDVSADQPTQWSVWGDGIEETAIISLLSPTEGAHLLSAFGDIGGFVHDNFDVSPPQGMYTNPRFVTTRSLDYAGEKANVIVRSGSPTGDAAPLAYSEDGGKTWQPLTLAAGSGGGRQRGAQAIIVSADGAAFIVTQTPPIITNDRGKTWTAIKGLPDGGRPVADRVDPQKFYSIDYNSGKIDVSTDGGNKFAPVQTQGLPDVKTDRRNGSEAAWPLQATPTKTGDLWLLTKTGAWHSPDAGIHFEKILTDLQIDELSFGKSPAGKDYPALFAIGTMNNLKAIWRSDDIGKTWIRLNDDQHQYGTRFRCIAGDPRIFGRVYFGTDGRGIFYGDIAQK